MGCLRLQISVTIFNEHTCWQIVGKDSTINSDNRAPIRLSLAEEDEIWSDVGEEVWPDVGEEVWSDQTSARVSLLRVEIENETSQGNF